MANPGKGKGIRNKNRRRKRGKNSIAQRKRRIREKLEAESKRVKEGLIPAKKPRTEEEDAATSNDVTIKVEPTDYVEEAMADVEQASVNIEPPAAINVEQPAAINVEQPAAINVEQPAAIDVEEPAAVNFEQAASRKKPSKFKPGPYSIQGRRIVDPGYFITELLNLSVHNVSGACSMGDLSISMECTKGIVSGFVFKCRVCKFRTVIWTEDPENDIDDMNADAILATMDLAKDFRSMNKYFSKMKLPRFNQHFFKWKYKTLTKVTAVGGEDTSDKQEWCGEEDMPSEGEKEEVLIHDSIVIKHEPEEILSEPENEELIGRTHVCEIPPSGIGAVVEMDKNIAAASGSSSATAQRGKKAIETFTLDAGSDITYSETNRQVKEAGNSETGVQVQDKSSVSVVENNLYKPKVDSTSDSCRKAEKRPYEAACITWPESNVSKRAYAYPIEFLVSLSKFVWSSLFICVDCLEDFSTHELIKVHSCKTYSRCILGVPPLTNFKKLLPSEKTRSCFETLKSSMAEKKSALDVAVSASKEVQRLMNLHAQSKRNTEQNVKIYEQALAKQKSLPRGSRDLEVDGAVTSAFSEIVSSMASEKNAAELLVEAKRNQMTVIEAAAEATERECFALVEFVKSLRGDKVDSPQEEASESRPDPPSGCQETSRTPCSSMKILL